MSRIYVPILDEDDQPCLFEVEHDTVSTMYALLTHALNTLRWSYTQPTVNDAIDTAIMDLDTLKSKFIEVGMADQ